MTAFSQRPFLPSERRPNIYIERAISAAVAAAVDPQPKNAKAVAKTQWPRDAVTPLLLRAPSEPTDTTTGAVFASDDIVADFVSSLAPISAAARLIEAGLRTSLGGRNSVSIPRRTGGKAAADVAWVTQANPIPARSFSLDEATLGPTCKLALITGVTRELAISAAGDDVCRTLVYEDLAASLDASLFSANAATPGLNPAGLLAGVSAITASTATPASEAMLVDLETLAGEVLDAGGVEVVYIASPRQAVAAQLRLLPGQATVWPCPALAAGTCIAIEPRSFVSAFGPQPRISASIEAAIHFETSPAQIGVVGTPNVVAAPTLSAFQSDLVVIRAILDAAWCMRQAGMVSFLTGATWGVEPT